jgi:hypothetical protein
MGPSVRVCAIGTISLAPQLAAALAASCPPGMLAAARHVLARGWNAVDEQQVMTSGSPQAPTQSAPDHGQPDGGLKQGNRCRRDRDFGPHDCIIEAQAPGCDAPAAATGFGTPRSSQRRQRQHTSRASMLPAPLGRDVPAPSMLWAPPGFGSSVASLSGIMGYRGKCWHAAMSVRSMSRMAARAAVAPPAPDEGEDDDTMASE